MDRGLGAAPCLHEDRRSQHEDTIDGAIDPTCVPDPMGRDPDGDRLADGGARHPRGRHGAEPDPPRSGGVGGAARVDGQCLQPELRGAPDHRGRARRSLRTPPPVLGRVGSVLGRVGGLRARTRRRLVDRRSRRTGRGFGVDHAARSRTADRGLSAGEARCRDRRVQRDHGSRGGERPTLRRRGRRGHRLALGLLAERSHRAGGDPAGADPHQRELRPRHRPRLRVASGLSRAAHSASSGA